MAARPSREPDSWRRAAVAAFVLFAGQFFLWVVIGG